MNLRISLDTHCLEQELDDKTKSLELSILMPCLNEAETLETCIRKAQQSLIDNHIHGEIIIADNGSTDGSQAIATGLGARVVDVEAKGYGNALMGGILAAHGKYIIMGDADDSYDFSSLKVFIEKLSQGYDLVMGNRFKGGIKPGAMPLLHKYLGNPVLTTIGRIFFQSPCRDFHCGLRGFSKAAVTKLNLRSTGMEFASEMVVKATLQKCVLQKFPPLYHRMVAVAVRICGVGATDGDICDFCCFSVLAGYFYFLALC